MDDLKTFLEDFSKTNNIKLLWSIESDPLKNCNMLIVVLQGEIKRVRTIYLYPKYGAIDFALFKERLYLQLCELGREEAKNETNCSTNKS